MTAAQSRVGRPVLAIAGQQVCNAIGGRYQQEVDLVSMYKDVAGASVQQASASTQVRHLVDRAVRIAIGERRVTAIALPNDLQDEAYESPPCKHGTVHSGVGFAKPRTLPFDQDLHRAADVLNAGEKVAILVGAGALGATDEVIAVAEKLRAGVAKALLGKAALPDDLPFVTGSIGLLGAKPSYRLMTECDTLLMVGSGFPYSEFLPEEGKARGVQIDIAPDMLSLRFPMEVNLVGDAKETLRALLPLIDQKSNGAWRDGIESEVKQWWRTLEQRAMQPANPVNPQRVTWELSPRLPDGVIVTSDSGSCANWYARDLKMRRGMMASLSGGLASMGAAMPYATAASLSNNSSRVRSCRWSWRLHSRLHQGAYRAQPARRRFIPKPHGRQRPLAVVALEGKIVQRATAAVLGVIYEEEFLGFSYGFRPKRSQHDALDALMVGIAGTRVTFVLDADIRSFFNEVSHASSD